LQGASYRLPLQVQTLSTGPGVERNILLKANSAWTSSYKQYMGMYL